MDRRWISFEIHKIVSYQVYLMARRWISFEIHKIVGYQVYLMARRWISFEIHQDCWLSSISDGQTLDFLWDSQDC